MFLFAVFVNLGDIIKRGRNHQPLTGGEAALLRLFDGVTVAILLAAWAAFMQYGPRLPIVHDVASALWTAVLLAWQKWAAGSGLAQLESGLTPPPASTSAAAAVPPQADAAPGYPLTGSAMTLVRPRAHRTLADMPQPTTMPLPAVQPGASATDAAAEAPAWLGDTPQDGTTWPK